MKQPAPPNPTPPLPHIDAPSGGARRSPGSRALLREADPEVVKTVKWRKPSSRLGVPVWEHARILCTGETYKAAVKLTLAKGAALADPTGLFNASLEGGTRRAMRHP